MAARPNTAHVTLSFKVARGCSARAARRALWNNLLNNLPLYLDPDEAAAIGTEVLRSIRISGARIEKAPKP